MIKRVLVLGLLSLMVFGGLALAKYRQIQTMSAKFAVAPAPTSVAVATVALAHWDRSLFAVGNVSAVQDVMVSTEVPGQIAEIRFESAKPVIAGEVLVVLDASIDLAELAGLKAAQRLAELQYTRADKLRHERTMSESQFDEADSRRSEAAALVRAKEAYIAKKTIRAPISGTLGMRRVDLGDYLAPGADIVALQMLDPVFVDYRLPERFLARLHLGQEVGIRVQSYGDRTFKGQITAIDPAIDLATRMARVRARLANPDGALRPGMFAEVTTLENQTDEVVLVPETAITYSPYGNSVYVVSASGDGHKVLRRPVSTGEVRAGMVAVSSGLTPGEQVVTVGQNKLRNELPVTIAVTAADAPSSTQ